MRKSLNLKRLEGEFEKHVGVLANAKCEMLRDLFDNHSTNNIIKFQDSEVVKTFCDKHNIDFKLDVLPIVAVVNFIVSEAIEKKINKESIVEEIDEFCSTKSIDLSECVKDLLNDFFNISGGSEEFLLRQKSVRSTLPNLTSLDSVIDNRAVFDEKDRYLGSFPVIIFRVSTDEENGREMVFQVDEDGYHQLLKILRKMESMLDQIKG